MVVSNATDNNGVNNDMIVMAFTRNNKAVLIINSTDYGRTWGKPRDISSSVVEDKWNWVATGPP